MSKVNVEIDKGFESVFNAGFNAICTCVHTTCTPQEHRRYWFANLTCKFELHPVVKSIVKQGVRPENWHQLLLEWPHVSVDDESMLAYTRDDSKGEQGVYTKTSVGKYLSRHWPHVPDNIRRDWAALHTPDRFEIWGTKEEIIRGIEVGPVSCMRSSQGSIPFTSKDHTAMLAYFKGDKETVVRWHYHPYACYAPEHGWRMAVRIDPGKPDMVMGRALVLERNGNKSYVRTYKRHAEAEGYSYADEALEAWLSAQGYTKRGSWPDGTRLAYMDHPCGATMAPYIDGGTQRVTIHNSGTARTLLIDGEGEYECSNTNGTMDECESENDEDEITGNCSCCGATVYEHDEERIWAGRSEDELIGSCCADVYTRVEGCNGRGGTRDYYVHVDYSVRVNDTYYDSENLPDCIVELHDGDYAHTDDAVYIDSCGEYYLHDDDICCMADGDYELVDNCVACADGEWRKKEDCWQCELSKAWYSDDEDYIEVDGEKYHEDALKELIHEKQMRMPFEEPVTATVAPPAVPEATVLAWPFVTRKEETEKETVTQGE